MIVKIADACTACGMCCDTCPAVFHMGDDIAEVISEDVLPEREGDVEQAAEECPVSAILLDDE